jgi:hypothetical protein
MKQHFIPRDATVAELEQKAARMLSRKRPRSRNRVLRELRGRGETLSRMGSIPAVRAVDLFDRVGECNRPVPDTDAETRKPPDEGGSLTDWGKSSAQ